jgi:hypothetical protein
MTDTEMGKGNTVKINTTETYKFGQVEGIRYTIEGMEEWDMNVMNDVGGTHGFNGEKSQRGTGKKP